MYAKSVIDKVNVYNALTGPQGDILQVIQGLWGQVSVLMGLLDAA